MTDVLDQLWEVVTLVVVIAAVFAGEYRV